MKIVLTNKSDTPIPYLLRCEGEKVGYIYYLPPGDATECHSLHTHMGGLVCVTSYEGICSFSYLDFPRLEITYVSRK